MTEEEMRDLDVWMAEHVFGIEVKRDAYNADGVIDGVVIYSSRPYSFSAVKREIERRGWDWGIGYHNSRPLENRYDFLIYVGDEQLGHIYAETEELAGCLALKEAVERHGF